MAAPASPRVRSILWRLPGPDQTQPRPRAVIVGHHPELSAVGEVFSAHARAWHWIDCWWLRS